MTRAATTSSVGVLQIRIVPHPVVVALPENKSCDYYCKSRHVYPPAPTTQQQKRAGSEKVIVLSYNQDSNTHCSHDYDNYNDNGRIDSDRVPYPARSFRVVKLFY